MSELHDLELDPVESPELPEPSFGDGDGERPWWLWPLVGLAALLLIGGGCWFFGRGDGESSAGGTTTPPSGTEEPSEPAASPVEEAAAEAIELPPLGESDALVRELVAGVSSHPALARWLVNERLVQRWVVSVDNLAEGVSPRKHVTFLRPRSGFATTSVGGLEVPAESSYRRYDTLTQAFVSLDVEGTAELYRQIEPLIDEAYRDLGYPGRDFDTTLAKAIDHLLDTPSVPGRVALSPNVTSYEYADPTLEELSDAQKQLLRLGPENVRRVKDKLRSLAAALELPTRG